jgi:hypothetical protein
MAKALHRKAVKRTGKSRRASGRRVVEGADFCAAARHALKRGELDAISDRALQQVLGAAVKIYAAKVERRGYELAPFPPNTVTATESVVAACGMIRAADLNMFDVAIWFHRPPGIE